MPHGIRIAALVGASIACSRPQPAADGSFDPPGAPGSLGADLAVDGSDLLATWLEPDGTTAHRLRFARLRADQWSAPVTIAEGPALVASWADFPSVTAGGDGALYAHWAEAAASGGEAYDVVLARSPDGGQTWRRLGTPHRDRTATEHGFVSMVAIPEGVRAFWLDGRALAAAGGSTALRTATVGKSIGADEAIDDRVCDCCSTSAATAAGKPVVAYRDRSGAEIRDIALVRGDAAARWSEPRPIHPDGWRIPGCPVNGPAIAASERQVAVAWYTYAGDRAAVAVAFSRDGGAGFSAPIEVDAPREQRAPLGRVDVALGSDGDAIVAWMSSDRERAEVTLRRVTADRRTGAPLTVATTTADRDAGFPRLVRIGDAVAVAWTDTTVEPSRVRVRRIALARVPAATEQASATSPAPAAAGARPGQPAPALTAATASGTASLGDLRGRVVLLNVWATWCEPCRQEMPELARLHREHAGAGLEVIGLSTDRDKSTEQVAAFAARQKLPFAIWHDRDDRASRALGIGALPATFLIGRDGAIAWRHDGAISADDEDLTAALAAALAPATPR